MTQRNPMTRLDILDKPIEQLTPEEFALLKPNEQRWALDYLRLRRHPPEWLQTPAT